MSSDTRTLRLGIIGLGAMGLPHVGFALTTPEIELTALCDTDPARIEKIRETYYSETGPSGPGAPAVSASALPLAPGRRPGSAFPPAFSDADALLASGLVDAVLIAVPHFDHEPIALAAFARGIHVLCEKPVSVTVQGVRSMTAAWTRARENNPGLTFAAMFMQRTWGHWAKVKALIDEGELGRIVRTTWIVTDWFRTMQYYRSGGWRATWNGEGGGVLTNQSPHNLDLLQWFLGMPETVTAFGGLGKHHAIAVEDEVTAVLGYADGSTAHFITSTAEAPGTNRLEIVAENGKLVYEDGKLTFHRNRSSMRAWSDTSPQMYAGPECWTCSVPFQHHGETGHRIVLLNFARAVLSGEPLTAQGAEGIGQVTLTNAMMVSLLEGSRTVTLAEADRFAGLLGGLQAREGRT